MAIIATTYSPRGAGAGGLPAWQVVIVATWDPATIAWIEKYMVPRDRLKLTVMPNRRELAAMRTDGQQLIMSTFKPDNYPFTITDAILIGPAEIQQLAPVQTVGTYTGYAIIAASMILQQTKPNDY